MAAAATAQREGSLVPHALEAAQQELARLRALDLGAHLSAEELLGPERPSPAVVVVAAPAAAAPLAPRGEGSYDNEEEGEEEELTESAQAEMRRLEVTIAELSETNDRIMAQNIALLADLEVAQRAVRDLRADKDAMAVQLKRALTGGGQ